MELLTFLNRVFLPSTCPNLHALELSGQDIGQALDGESFTGEMAGQQQADAQGFRLQTGVKAGLAHDHRGAAVVLPCGVEQFAGPLHPTATVRTVCFGSPTNCNRSIAKKLLEPRGKLPERKWIGEPSPAARALAFRVRQQRRDAAKLKAGGQTLVDPLAGRVERRMALKTAMCAAIKSSSIRPIVVSAVSRFVAANGMGWCVTINSAPASVASAALVGVTVRQVISFVTLRSPSPTSSPTLSQSSASRKGASCSRNAAIAATVGMEVSVVKAR